VTQHLWWYVARAGGIVAWALVAASVLWGLALSTKALGKRPRANWLLDLHRYLGGLALVFTGIHVGALVLDSYFAFGLTQLLVPFTSAYRPVAVAWGVVGLYLLAAVEVTSLLRARIPKRLWRRVHMVSFPLYGFSTVHGLFAGADATGRLLFAVMVLTTIAIAVLTALRINQATTPPTRRLAHVSG
jgi:DMSO/TMAO reductase YedYZ heme-binding membrane subunit